MAAKLRERVRLLDELRTAIAGIERRSASTSAGAVLPFGHPELDAALPGRGLAFGALHEVAGSGLDVEYGAAAALFVAGVLARMPGPVLWVLERYDLFTPALAGVGLHPARVLYAEAGWPASVLLVMEEGLRHRGLAGVVGEVSSRLTLTASRRLQLAAESSGTLAIALRRSRRHDDPALAEPSAAVTRWRIAALPSPPPLPHAPDVPGLGRARWQLDLMRIRGAEPRTWTVEACDAQGCLGMGADMGDRQATPVRGRASA